MRMSEAGFITDDHGEDRAGAAGACGQLTGAGSVNYVADWIMDVLDDLVGHVDQDIVVETTIDPVLQAAAEKALVEELAQKGAQVSTCSRARSSP